MEKFNSKMLKHLEDGGIVMDDSGHEYDIHAFNAKMSRIINEEFTILARKKTVYRRLYNGITAYIMSKYYNSIDELNAGIVADTCAYLGPIEELELPDNGKATEL